MMRAKPMKQPSFPQKRLMKFPIRFTFPRRPRERNLARHAFARQLHTASMSLPTSPTAAPLSPEVRHRGWSVALAGLGINLALGILYTWSMIKGAIEKEFGWQRSQLNDPYALCCLVFAFAMILAGRCQDRIGPRITASIGGLLVGAGLVLSSTSNSYGVWLLGFGVLVGLGLGFGYSSATPPALKWFPPSKTGQIAGLVVAGFGL